MKSSQAISPTGPVFGMSRNTPVTFQNVCVCDYKKRCYQLSLQSNSCTCSYTYWILIVKVFLYFIRALLFVIFIIFHFNMSRLFSLFHAFNTSIFFTSPSPMVWKSDKMAAMLGMTSVWPCLDWGQKKILKATATKVITSKKKLLYYKNVTRDWFFRLLVESIRKLYNWLKHRDLTNTSNHVQFSTHQEKSSLPPVFPPLSSIPYFLALCKVSKFYCFWQRFQLFPRFVAFVCFLLLGNV